MSKETPNYYAILTAEIRYDNRLSSLEKLLCAEITALSSKYGYCFATNNYFADLYGISKETVSRRLNHIKELGYLEIQILYTGKQITGRKMKLKQLPFIPNDVKVDTPNDEKEDTPHDEKGKGNNTRVNNIKSNRDDVQNSIDYINHNLEMITSPMKIQEIEYLVNDIKKQKLEIVKVATNYCKENRKGVNYLIKVLTNWINENIDTKEKAEDKIKPKTKKAKSDNFGDLRQKILGGASDD
ncbi:DnaD domain protein [Mammaliicoccus sciuri]|uniref:DnaD domain protein n=1 Tax=Mammaliicoccus sciuri TaxID=1296 RepID=UPI0010725691|nr:DnaD domain protein [Mammaliicoccus sciuri]MBF0773248.1 helix-turn-helix domain-containing protein [Mammaliicoccus sciuri]TFU88270.1 DnaD domain protein [Mammaliicoccus sciuri]